MFWNREIFKYKKEKKLLGIVESEVIGFDQIKTKAIIYITKKRKKYTGKKNSLTFMISQKQSDIKTLFSCSYDLLSC